MLQNEVMTVSEVADYLRLNPQTVYRKAKAGELPALRIGRAIRFRRAELEQWMRSSTTVTSAGTGTSLQYQTVGS